MNPTEEQAMVLQTLFQDMLETILIHARAGCGKTTLLKILAWEFFRRYPKRKILYLVFNRSQRIAAQKVFPPNTHVHTYHSAAFKGEGFLWKNMITTNFTPYFFLDAFEGDQQYVEAQLAHAFMSYYLNSPYHQFEDAVETFLPYLSESHQKTFLAFSTMILRASDELFVKWLNKKEQCPHDFYLKVFYERGGYQALFDHYDLVMLDEAHDQSELMIDLAKKTKTKLYLVGDEHQQIYSFRYANDALAKVPYDAEYQLTQSFRFGPRIAEFVQTFVRETLDSEFVIKGTPGIDSAVYQYSDYRDVGSVSAILSRTNGSVFSAIVDCQREGIPYRFERDLTSVVYKTLDLWRLRVGKVNEVKDEFLKKLGSFAAVEDYVEEVNDMNTRSLLTVVKTYSYEMPGMLFQILRDAKANNRQLEEGVVTISTIHTSKGCEFPEVVIDKDLAKILNQKDKSDDEDVRLTYVGQTRGINKLYVHHDMAQVAGPEFEATVHALPRV